MYDDKVKNLSHPQGFTTAILIIGLLSVVFRFWLWTAYESTPQIAPDSAGYLQLGIQLAETGIFGVDGRPEITRTPGYPGVIATFQKLGLGIGGLILVQSLLSLGIAVIVGTWSKRRFGPSAGALTTFLVAFNFPLNVYSLYVLTEIIFTALVTVSAILLLRSTKSEVKKLTFVLTAGLLLGVSVLVRPITVFAWVPVVIFILVFSSRKWVVTITFLLSFALSPATWVLRNYVETGQPMLSDIGTVNLLYYQSAGTLAMESGLDFDSQFLIEQARLKQWSVSLTDESFEGQQRELREKFISIAKEHPLSMVLNTARNAGLTLLGYESTELSRVLGIEYKKARTIAFFVSSLSLILGFIGAIHLWRRDREFLILSLLLFSYFVAVSAVSGVGGTRFRVPVEPILGIGVSLGLVEVKRFLKRRRLRRD